MKNNSKTTKTKKINFYDFTLLRKDVMSKRVIELNISSKQLAKKCNMAHQIITKIENKRLVSIDSLIRICNALKLDYRNYLIN